MLGSEDEATNIFTNAWNCSPKDSVISQNPRIISDKVTNKINSHAC
jgi:hypothetical protein